MATRSVTVDQEGKLKLQIKTLGDGYPALWSTPVRKSLLRCSYEFHFDVTERVANRHESHNMLAQQ